MRPFSYLGGDIRGVRWERPGAPKVLAFHGFLDHAYSFKPLALELHDVELWCIDMPGHGLSNPLPEGDGTLMIAWLPVLGRFLDELGWEQVTILGHSMGAVVAQLLAGVDSRVKTVLALDALGPLASDTEQNLERFQRLYDAREKRFPKRYYAEYETLVQSRRKGMFPLSEAATKVMAERAVGLTPKGYFHRYDRRLREESLWRLSEQDVLAWLAKIECPVHLLMFGAQNWPGYKEVYESRLSAIVKCELTDMPGSHHLHLESPTKVAPWVRSVLNPAKHSDS